MKILVTGAKGFVGRNLAFQLKNQGYSTIFEYDIDTDPGLLEDYTRNCDFVFHLAGVNRPENPEEFMTGNFGVTSDLLGCLKRYKNKAPVLMASSIQATQDNPYGQSKRAAEQLIFFHEKETGTKTLIYRLPNIFGKWCRPNYNSVVATFCHNIARDLPVQINDPDAELRLVYIDDVTAEFISALNGGETRLGEFCGVNPIYNVRLNNIAALLRSFRESRDNLSVPNLDDAFEKKLYSAYLSYLPEDGFAYPLTSHADERGSFTEFIRTPERGQFSVNILKPGVTKGNHWHHTKNEKFLAVGGDGIIRFRRVDGGELIEYPVSGDDLRVVDIPPGYAHSIVNTGRRDMIVLMWASECYNPENHDTYAMEVSGQ